ncbi:FG-GAP repeat protein [Dokdonella sp.]|uniref:FG-GAP repeat protein n=1 Tax=Dokdonella sp. TaxID=2291710 RepID=UPI0037846381
MPTVPATLATLALATVACACAQAAEPATDFSALIVKGSIGLPGELGATSISALAAGDFDCDGNADIAIGDADSTVGTHAGAGSVTIAFGDRLLPIRVTGQRFNQSSSGVQGGAETGDEFGAALAVADVDNDGCDDLAVGIPGEDTGSPTINDAGGVGVFRGSATGVRFDDDVFLPRASEAAPNGPSDQHRKGTSLAMLDRFTSASSLPMLAIGTPGHSPFPNISAGGASIRRSNTDPGDFIGLVTFVDRGGAGFGNVTTDDLGNVMASGDFDHDGHADLALYGRHKDGGQHDEGYVLIAYGADTLAGVTYERIDQDSPGVPGAAESADEFGSALASGDFDGDGFDDLAVGALSEDIDGVFNAGSVTILFGSGAGLLLNALSSVAYDQRDFPDLAMEAGDEFGGALASGDFNRDGFDDLLIGDQGEDIGSTLNAGIVLHVPGSAGGLVPSAARGFSLATAGMPESPAAADRFGAQLAVGDFNDDNLDDFVVGLPGRKDGGGTVKGAIALVYSVSDTTTTIASVDPPVGAVESSVIVHVSNRRTPVVGLPLGRGTVTVTSSQGESCSTTIASNGLGHCTLAVHGAGSVTINAHYSAQIGFRASDAAPFAYTVQDDDTIFRNGFDAAN